MPKTSFLGIHIHTLTFEIVAVIQQRVILKLSGIHSHGEIALKLCCR